MPGTSFERKLRDGNQEELGRAQSGYNYHPSVGSENHNNLCGDLLVGNVSWAAACS